MQFKTYISITLFLFLFCFTGFSQSGRINGKVIDSKTGEALIGATITIVPGNKTVLSDQKGEYSYLNLKPTVYSISCSYVGYAPKTIPGVDVKAGDVTVQDIVMDLGSESKEIVIKAPPKINKENTSALLIAQKNMANFSDGISAEAIRRTPDRSTSDVLKRVSGASIQDDRFAIIRGLNDRYNAAFINGAPLPSSESDKKSFAFDIFPSNILDNLVILKTATPDQTAEFGGGIINITTKSIPDRDFQSISIGIGFNSNATFHTRKSYKGGRWDLIGLDDGQRDLPYNFPSKQKYQTFTPDDKSKWGKSLSSYDWSLHNGMAAPNVSFQYAVGTNIPRNNKDFFGAIISVSYNRSSDFYKGTRNTWEATINSPAPSIQLGKYNDRVYSDESLLGVLANFSLKLNSNNTLGFKNLVSINTDDRVILRDGWNDFTNANDIFFKNSAYWFTSNVIVNSQLTGEHFIKKPKIKLSWVGSYAHIKRSVPNLRRMQYRGSLSANEYFANIDQSITSVTDGAGIHFFSSNSETLFSGKLDASRSFNIGKAIKTDFKTGLFFQDRKRDFDARTLQVIQYIVAGNSGTFDDALLKLPIDQIFQKQNFGKQRGGKTGFLLEDASQARDGYSGASTTAAYYAMMDTRLFKFARFIYGVRLEDFSQQLTSLGSSYVDTVRVNNTQHKFFPSASAVFSLTNKMNLRIAYSETVNRPEFRELAPFVFYDVALNLSVAGNPLLKNCLITNTDIRYEFYPGRAQLLSVSVFQKQFKNPIELFIIPATTNFATYDYVNDATVQGAELEFRSLLGALFNKDKGILSKLTVFSNLAFIKSKVKLLGTNTTRRLQGQSPYIVNGGVSYSDDERGLSFNLIANRIGPRIIALGSNGSPDFFENARTVVDLQASYSLKKNIELKLNIRDVLARQLVLFQDFNANNKYEKNTDLIFGTRNYGRVFSVNISYKF